MQLSEKAQKYYEEYLATLPPGTPWHARVESWYFCNNEPCANELAELVRQGIKTGTAGLYWEFEAENEPLPEVGGISVITNWAGEPVCIIETTWVSVVPYNQVDAEHAYSEGEGERTLESWRKDHWKFFGEQAAKIEREINEDMPVVCERFRLLYTGR